MSRGGRSGGSGRTPRPKKERLPAGTAADDDALVWGHVARQVSRSRMRPRVPSGPSPPDAADRQMLLRKGSRAAEGLGQTVVPAEEHVSPPATRPRGKAPPLAAFDRRQARRIGSGQIEIDARLDLHGMRQGEAHAALHRFLFAAHARGDRIALVITGKGSPLARDDADGVPGRDRGVLKRNVPRWLGEPELRAIVVSHTAAHVRHGGDGALYVRLRSV